MVIVYSKSGSASKKAEKSSSVSLVKGQQLLLPKPEGPVEKNHVLMGLGWSARRPGFWRRLIGIIEEIDLDASCLMLDKEGNAVDTVWFRQLNSKDGSIRHSGDNRTGNIDETLEDDEHIFVDLDKVPPNIVQLIFVVNSFTGQTFNHIENAFCRLVDLNSSKEVARYELTGFGPYTAQIMTRLYRDGSDWRMQALGEEANGHTAKQLLPTIRKLL